MPVRERADEAGDDRALREVVSPPHGPPVSLRGIEQFRAGAVRHHVGALPGGAHPHHVLFQRGGDRHHRVCRAIGRRSIAEASGASAMPAWAIRSSTCGLFCSKTSGMPSAFDRCDPVRCSSAVRS